MMTALSASAHETAKGGPHQHPEEEHRDVPEGADSSFFYVSFLQGMVGGLPGAARSIYLDDAGDLEVSEFTTDGVLRRLVRAGGFASSFDRVKALVGASGDAIDGSPGEEPLPGGQETPLVSDYYPATTVYAFRLGGRLHHFEEFTDGTTPPGVSDAVALLESLADAPPPTRNTGLFVRAEPSPLEREPDIRIEESAKGRDERLGRLLSRPLKLVQVSPDTGPQLVGDQLVIKAGQAVLVEDRGCLYFLQAYASVP